ncbi:MAG TPA: type II toxin-antitoxin system HicA family toxin [Methylobacterium sp.]
MSQAVKRLEAMRRNPVGDWRISDIEVVSRAFGIHCVSPTRGSHYDLSHPTLPRILTIPARKPVKAAYIRDFVSFVDAVRKG